MTQVRPVQSAVRFFGMSKSFSLVALMLACGTASALESLDDSSMESVSGAGIVYGLDDFSFRMAPTSYIELIGTAPLAGAAAYGWKRGDARYYGMSFTYGAPCNVGTGPGTGTDCAGTAGGGTSVGVDWAGNSAAIAAGGNMLAYPMGKKTTPGTTNPYGIVGFASVYNPFILRVYQYKGYDYGGNYLDQASGASNVMPTVVEFMGPSKTDPWRWAFWGELEINRGGACPTGGNVNYCGLKSQTIIHGSPTASGQTWVSGTTYSAVPAQRRSSILRLMQTPDTSTGAPFSAGLPTLKTFGISYQSALSGDFRFSVQQTGTDTALHTVPTFNTNEGFFFKNVDAFLPLGVLHSQALIASGASTYDANGVLQTSFQQNGNFVLELARIPNQNNVYNFVYCGATASGNTATTCATTASPVSVIASPNADTHSYIRWGNWTTANGVTTGIDPYTATPGTGAYSLPTATSTGNGIYFSDGAGAVTNLGISRIEGMMIHHMRISSLGSGL